MPLPSDIFNPSPEHASLREMVRSFAEREVEPQAAEHDRNETFNLPLFRKLPHLAEVSIGHALISHALQVGLDRSVRDYLDALR